MSQDNFADIIPYGDLGIIALESSRAIGEKVDNYVASWRNESRNDEESIHFTSYKKDSYLIDAVCPRFGSGESKGLLNESVRGKDLYILLDVCNHSLTYKVCGQVNHMSPDDHYQDLKRIIAAVSGKARRITVIMPFLYEGRQHKRSSRESLDCALALQELTNMGVESIITFDAHDPRVQNAIPLNTFETIQPTYQFIKAMLKNVPDIQMNPKNLMIISPDEGATGRAIYFAGVAGVDMGMFYKRRDYTKIVEGRNPIVAHEFLGADVEGKDVVIIDDMISSGGSMLDVAKQMKERGARNVYVCCTFGLFTDGFEKFDEYYEKGYIKRIVTTNLNYRSPELLEKPYYTEADMTKFLATIIDTMNHDTPIGKINNLSEKIRNLLEKRQNGELRK